MLAEVGIHSGYKIHSDGPEELMQRYPFKTLANSGSRRHLQLLSLALVLSIALTPTLAQKNAAETPTPDDRPKTGNQPVTLQGSLEMQEMRNTNFDAWQASQWYRQGAAALSANNYAAAAERFKQAGDGFATSIGEGKFLGEARYAEAQARRLMKQNAQAVQLFGQAVEMFRKYDPYNPYLRAGVGYIAELSKHLKAEVSQAQPRLTPLKGHVDKIDSTVALRGKLTEAEGGFKLSAMKDSDFFDGSKRLLTEAAAVDVSDAYTKNAIYKSFLKMNCLEFTALGANYYTANDIYKPFKSGGKTVVVGAADEFWSPVVRLTINGQLYPIVMDLPGIAKHTKNVLLLTDGNHVLAIDPRTQDAWKLVSNFSGKRPDFNWWKLSHQKKGAKPAK